jgi:signal transduction histidine kinase
LENSLEQATRLIDLERAQVGHEIHDALLPLIFAASASVSSLAADQSIARSDDVRDKLRQIATWLDEAMQTGRRLLTQVDPPELVDQIWTTVAKDTLERLFGETSSLIRWQIDSDVDETSAPVAIAAYRIVVEAVRNAIRHGKASEVTIVGQKVDRSLRVVIRDNGCGFDPSQVAQDRFGIRAMIGRAELVGGTIVIDSAVGGPTTVTFTT